MTTLVSAAAAPVPAPRAARVTWPHYWELRGADLDEAVRIAADPAAPEWELAHLPSAHVAVLDTLLGRKPQTRASRKAVYVALRFGVMLAGTGALTPQGRMLAWAHRVLQASWLTERRFGELLGLAAMHGPLPLLVPVLARHRRFTPAAAGMLVDAAHDLASDYETVNVKEAAITAVRDLGGSWESYAAVFYAALGQGHGMRWHRGLSFQQVAHRCAVLDDTQRVTLGQLLLAMPQATLPELVELAVVVGRS